MAHYLITGGTGFIGSELSRQLLEAGHSLVLLTRAREKHEGRFPADRVRLVESFDEVADDERFDGIVNLAGAGIADKRWSTRRKQVLLDSREGVTRALVELVGRLGHRPQAMVSGSAVGWYGAQGERTLDEDAEPVGEFTHELCQAWEEAARPVREYGVRLCLVRLGPVLGRDGGMLAQMLPAFKAGVGGRLGSGHQYISWVHLQDAVKGIVFLLQTPSATGVYNLCAPHPVSNRRFTKALGRGVRRPTLFPMPAFMIRLLFGEMGDRLLLHGQKVFPIRLNREGYVFDYETIDEAMAHIFARP